MSSIGKQQNWQWIFPKISFFVSVTVRISQNIQNEVSVERSLFTDIVAYQLISLKGTLNGSTKETCIVSYGTKTSKAVVVKLYHSHPSKVSEGKKKGRKERKEKKRKKGKKEINLIDSSLYKVLGVEEAEHLVKLFRLKKA